MQAVCYPAPGFKSIAPCLPSFPERFLPILGWPSSHARVDLSPSRKTQPHAFKLASIRHRPVPVLSTPLSSPPPSRHGLLPYFRKYPCPSTQFTFTGQKVSQASFPHCCLCSAFQCARWQPTQQYATSPRHFRSHRFSGCPASLSPSNTSHRGLAHAASTCSATHGGRVYCCSSTRPLPFTIVAAAAAVAAELVPSSCRSRPCQRPHLRHNV